MDFFSGPAPQQQLSGQVMAMPYSEQQAAQINAHREAARPSAPAQQANHAAYFLPPKQDQAALQYAQLKAHANAQPPAQQYRPQQQHVVVHSQPSVPPQTSAAQAPLQAAQPAAAPVPPQPAAQEPPATSGQRERDNFGLVLPLSRIKKLIKQEGSVKAISAEAAFAVARATEMLVEALAVRASAHMREGQRSIIIYKDVASSVKEWPAADFLADIVPETITVGELRELLAKQQQEQKAAAAAKGADL
ncbi:hypothetical protein WJX73_008666 [Symbiochloris irregularis]|uniref:Transcription factor CBF/NF-Y/archaeal histone domain-containing protein n=1 Tax=Symbiochloris irregularis TaxID=706552 RepID=A0AAW1NI98_9CHLO